MSAEQYVNSLNYEKVKNELEVEILVILIDPCLQKLVIVIG